MFSKKGLLNALLVVLFLFRFSTAQETSAVPVNIPRINTPVNIDGYLNDSAWKDAAKVQDFFTFRPVDGLAAKERTAVLFAYDESSFYAAVICFDPDPPAIRASLTSRDQIFEDDFIILYLDTFNNGKEAYQFGLNPLGIQADGILVEAVGEDFNPDYIFYSKGRRFKGGYIVEMEIPFKSLRFPSTANQTWGAALTRRINHLDEDLVWPAISRNQSTFIGQFAELRGLRNLDAGNNIEILPEFTSDQQGAFDGNSFEEGPVRYDSGLNFKYGITSNMTLDMAYNPDFSQVEADADLIDVNRRFPLFYDEKRPFFLEGTNIFDTPITAVYTRRIVDPEAGIKLSGRIGDYSIGLLSAIDPYYGSKTYLNQQLAFSPAADAQSIRDKFLYKRTYQNIARIKKDIFENSNIGILVSDKQQGDAFSRAYGVDGNFIINNQYVLTFQAMQSQHNSIFDQTTRSDPAFYASLYRASRTFNIQLFYNDIFPDFEVANGFLERTDIREFGSQAWYDILSSEGFFTRISPSVYLNQLYDHSGNKIEQLISPAITFETIGQTSLSLRYLRKMEEFLGTEFQKNQYSVDFSNRTFSWLVLSVNAIAGEGIYYSSDPFTGWVQSLNFGMTLKPFKNWSNEIRFSNYLFNGWNEGFHARINQDILRLKTTYQFTPELYFRLIAEQNNYYRDVDINILLSYQLFPGTVLFVGYNDYFLRNTSDELTRYSRGLFSKFSYLFRF